MVYAITVVDPMLMVDHIHMVAPIPIEDPLL